MVGGTMKRLIKKSDDGDLDNNHDQIEQIEQNPDNLEGLVKLDEMDEADIRHERCPACNYHPISRYDGFKQCPKCNTTYKILDGIGYMVSK